jgi:hypothetical protein
VTRRPERSEQLSEAALIAKTGISRRALIRGRQQGLIPTIAPRRGLGRGRGTTPLEYPEIAVATINRLNELRRKDVEEKRWLLWLEGYPVRIGPDLADILHCLRVVTSQIKTLDDIETKIPAGLFKLANMSRNNPLRVIFRNVSDDDLRSLITMVTYVVLGIKLPLFDEPNPYPFQIFKRALGLPKEWQMPPGLLDVFPYMHEQIRTALVTATNDELEGARAACRLLSRLFDNPENWRRGAIVIAGTLLPWRPIKFSGLMWQSPIVRAATAGLVVLGIRMFKSALGDEAAHTFASIANGLHILFPEFGPSSSATDQFFDTGDNKER